MIRSAYPIPFFHAFSFFVTPASNWPAAALHAWLNQLRMVAGNVVEVKRSQPFWARGSSSSRNALKASKQRWMALAWGISPPFTVGSQGACLMMFAVLDSSCSSVAVPNVFMWARSIRWRASKVRFLMDSCRFILARASSTPSAHLFNSTCMTCDSSYLASAMACDATLSRRRYSAWIRLCLSLSRAVATLTSTARNRVPRIIAILAVKASCDRKAIKEG